VRSLQEILNITGFVVDADGKFEPKTDGAVRKFQPNKEFYLNL